MSTTSIVSNLPFSKTEGKETNLSFGIRNAAKVIGVIGITLGALALFNVPGLNVLGNLGGGILAGAGAGALILGMAIKSVKKENEEIDNGPKVDAKTDYVTVTTLENEDFTRDATPTISNQDPPVRGNNAATPDELQISQNKSELLEDSEKEVATLSSNSTTPQRGALSNEENDIDSIFKEDATRTFHRKQQERSQRADSAREANKNHKTPQQIDQLEKITNMQDQISAMQKQLETLQNKHDTKNSECENLVSYIAILQAQITEAPSTLENRVEVIDAMKIKLESHKNALNEAAKNNNHTSAMSNKIKDLETKINNELNKSKLIENETIKNEKLVPELILKRESLKNELNELKNQIANLSKEITDATSQLNSEKQRKT